MSAPTRRRVPRVTRKPPPAAERPPESQQSHDLTLADARQQAHRVLIAAGVIQLMSRVVVDRSLPGEPGAVRTVALLAVGADSTAVAAVLSGLPGVVHMHVGESAVAVYREARAGQDELDLFGEVTRG